MTEGNMMFKSWIKDLMEAVTPAHKSGIYGVPANQREVGTESMRKYAQSMVPGQETIIGVYTKNIRNFIYKYRKSKKK